MKQIIKGKDPLIVNNAFMKKTKSGKRVLLCIPATLHGCIDEIRFRANITLRSMVSDALAPYISDKEIAHSPSASLHFCSIAADRAIETSVILSDEEYNTLRTVHYFWKVSYSTFLVDCLIKHIAQVYGEKYPNTNGMDLILKAAQK